MNLSRNVSSHRVSRVPGWDFTHDLPEGLTRSAEPLVQTRPARSRKLLRMQRAS